MNEVCRICESEYDLKLIFNRRGCDIPKKLNEFAGVEVRNGDGLPKHVCEPCIENLEFCNNFRLLVQFTDRKFRELFGAAATEETSTGLQNPPVSTFEPPRQELPIFTVPPQRKSYNFPQYQTPSPIHPHFHKKSIISSVLDVSAASASSSILKVLTDKSQVSFNPTLKDETVQASHRIEEIVLETTVSKINPERQFKEENKSDTEQGKYFGSIIIESDSDYDKMMVIEKLEDDVLSGFSFDEQNDDEKILSELRKSVQNGPSTKQMFAFPCNECDKKFHNEETMNQHKLIHDLESVSCNECGQTFTKQKQLMAHIAKVHRRNVEDSTSSDEEKNQTTRKLKRRKLPTRYRESPEEENCYETSTISTTQESNSAYQIKDSKNDARSFECSMCGERFESQTDLGLHRNSHVKNGIFFCSDCGASFRQGSQLKQHLYKHRGVFPFECSYCDRKFTLKSNKVCHERTHTGERPFNCDLCELSFSHSNALKGHRRTHTGEKPYVCPFDGCKRSFVQHQQLQCHKLTHTGEKRHRCRICGKAFALKGNRDTHEKTHNKSGSLKSENVESIESNNMLEVDVLEEEDDFREDTNDRGYEIIKTDHEVLHAQVSDENSNSAR